MMVSHPQFPDWGIGQVQSNSAGRIAVNFPDQGKVVFDATKVFLVLEFPPET